MLNNQQSINLIYLFLCIFNYYTDQGSHSHSSTGNAAAENHNLHAKDGEMITLQRSPGRTRLVSAGQISIGKM